MLATESPMAIPGTGMGDNGMNAPHPADAGADGEASHMPVSRLQIGSWNLVSKFNEHLMLSFHYGRRKLVWEILHVGIVRKMEIDFEDVTDVILSTPPGDPAKMVIELARPPRFYKEQSLSSQKTGNYVFTTDFTNGQASQVSRHMLYFANGVVNKHIAQVRSSGLPFRLESEGLKDEFGMPQDMGVQDSMAGGMPGRSPRSAAITSLRAPPTSSPRLDAITLQEQLDREMRDRQARYIGICPIRDEIYSKVFDELITAVTFDCTRRGLLLRRVRDEARMTIDAYRTVYESSINFGVRKLTQAVEVKGDREQVISDLEVDIKNLKKEVEDMQNRCESLQYRADEAKKKYEQKDKEQLDLIKSNQQLEDLLKVLQPSKQ